MTSAISSACMARTNCPPAGGCGKSESQTEEALRVRGHDRSDAGGSLCESQSRNQNRITGKTIRRPPSTGFVRVLKPDAVRGGSSNGNGLGGGFAPGRLHGHGWTLKRRVKPDVLTGVGESAV